MAYLFIYSFIHSLQIPPKFTIHSSFSLSKFPQCRSPFIRSLSPNFGPLTDYSFTHSFVVFKFPHRPDSSSIFCPLKIPITLKVVRVFSHSLSPNCGLTHGSFSRSPSLNSDLYAWVIRSFTPAILDIVHSFHYIIFFIHPLVAPEVTGGSFRERCCPL